MYRECQKPEVVRVFVDKLTLLLHRLLFVVTEYSKSTVFYDEVSTTELKTCHEYQYSS